MDKVFNPNEDLIGGYSSCDGTIEFYGRISILLKPDFRILDYGAGRGSWFFEDTCEYRKKFRDLKSKVHEVIGVDIDSEVLSNPTTTRNIQINDQDSVMPLDDESIDLIICDYVLEHLTSENLEFLTREVSRVLKPGGFFCARTPHYWHYVCVGSRLFSRATHIQLLQKLQPGRKMQDVFPAHYKCNTHRQISQFFSGWESFSYTYVPEPSYFLGNRLIFNALSLFSKLMPSCMAGNLFIFLRKV